MTNKSKLFQLLILIFFTIFITACDAKKAHEPVQKQPWGEWLFPDLEHEERRLQVKLGEQLYQIPVSYLTNNSWGHLEIVNDPDIPGLKIIASYPDLIPMRKTGLKGVPHYPNIDLFLMGLKNDRYAQSITTRLTKKNRDKDLPLDDYYLRNCGEPFLSTVAKDMYQYDCKSESRANYFTPVNPEIRTPAGYKVFILCNNNKSYHYKYRCSINNRLYDDGRHFLARFRLIDLTSLLDVYNKTIELLTSFEAPE